MQTRAVLIEASGSLVETHLWRAEWKSVFWESGAQFVMTFGAILMLVLPAGLWGIHSQVLKYMSSENAKASL